MKTKNSKNLGITALLAVLIVGVVLISGCIKEPEKQAPVTPKPNVTVPPGEQPPERPQADPKPNVTAPPGEQPPERPPAVPKPNVTAPPREQPPERPLAERHVTDETLREILGRGAGISSVKYDMIMTAPWMPPMTMRVWQKKNKMRTEQTMREQTIVNLIDMDAKTMYQYMPVQNVAMKMDFRMAPKSPIVSYINETHEPAYVIVGTETIDGKVCIVYEATIEGVKTKYWVWKEKGFPLRTEVIVPEGKMITEYKNIEFVDIDDRMFELPPGVRIMETPIGDMPPGMPYMHQEENMTE